MTIPQIQQSIDVVALQNAIALILRDEPRLSDIPIVPELKLHMEGDMQASILWTIPRSAFTVTALGVTVNQQSNQGATAPVGAGIMVEMPTASTKSPNVSGAPNTWDIGIVAFEERNMNITPQTGTGLMSEQICLIAKDVLHLQQIFGFGCLRVKENWFSPAHDWMGIFPGIIANRVVLEGISAGPYTPRSKPVMLSYNAGTGLLTMTCNDATATIRYTNDGTMPVSANSNAQQYTTPIAVSAGDYILAASRTPTTNLSEIFGLQI